MNDALAYGQTTPPSGIRSRLVPNVNGFAIHLLEAGFESPGRPCVVLLHGFPELAYSWRKVMLPLAQAGYHVIAPDQRGYGRSGGSDVGFQDSLWPFTLLNHVRDTLGLVRQEALVGVQRVGLVLVEFGQSLPEMLQHTGRQLRRSRTKWQLPLPLQQGKKALGVPCLILQVLFVHLQALSLLGGKLAQCPASALQE